MLCKKYICHWGPMLKCRRTLPSLIQWTLSPLVQWTLPSLVQWTIPPLSCELFPPRPMNFSPPHPVNSPPPLVQWTLPSLYPHANPKTPNRSAAVSYHHSVDCLHYSIHCLVIAMVTSVLPKGYRWFNDDVIKLSSYVSFTYLSAKVNHT